jgi:hypothetical protein
MGSVTILCNVIHYFNFCCTAQWVGYRAVYVQSTRQFCVNLEALRFVITLVCCSTFPENIQ